MAWWQAEFELDPSIIYLNHAGVAPWPKRTREAVEQFTRENTTQGAARYLEWLEVERRLRERLRRLLNALSVEDIALVKNTSEAISFVAFGLKWREGENMIITDEEFPSNHIPWGAAARRFGLEVREARLKEASSAEEAIFKLVDRNTRLISVSSVQYATGRRMDLERIGEFCKRKGILFCVDAIQSLGALRADVQAWQADFVMADGHKWMLGPEGIGVFYTTPEARDELELMEYGWHMVEQARDYERREWEVARSARRFECGSPNFLGTFALEASLSLLEDVGYREIAERVLEHARQIRQFCLVHSKLQCLTPEEHGGIVTFRPRSGDPKALYRQLRAEGIICALRGGGIRFSPHFYLREAQIEEALRTVVRLLF